MDVQIRQFRNELLQLINSVELPLEVKRLVLNEIFHAVSDASDEFIRQQQNQIAQSPDNDNQDQPEEEE